MTYESSKKWEFPDAAKESELTEYETVSPILAQLLHRKGVKPEHVESYINPNLESIPDWRGLHGVREAAGKIVDAVRAGCKIYIHGDFDADGVCATALLWEFLYHEAREITKQEVDALPYIPDRVDEGYGLSESSLDKMIEGGAELIITVDCGIRDKKLIQRYMKEKGVEIIVTDHHEPPEALQKGLNYTIVHQKFPEDEFPEREICGSVIIMMLAAAVRDALGVECEISSDTKELDLAALATVTDLMPLVGMNRVIVSHGLDSLRKGGRVGLHELISSAGAVEDSLEAYHLGFVIGPRLNAAGRIGNATDALKLLLTSDQKVAKRLSRKLNVLNSQRQELTQKIVEEAILQANKSSGDDKLIFVVGNDWEEGIVGLVASRLLEYYNKPTIVGTQSGSGVKGSCRSIDGISIIDAIESNSQYLERFGGHPGAAGFTVKEGEIEQFKEAMIKYMNENILENDLVRSLKIDLEIQPDELTIPLLNDLDQLKPFGFKNPKPLLALTNVEVIDIFIMGSGNNHLKLTVKGQGSETVNAVLFDCKEDIERLEVGNVVSLAGYANLNEWNGKKEVQFMVKEWTKN